MRITVLWGIPEDANLRKQWNALVECVEPREIFYTYEWACAVQTVYRESMEVLLLLGYEAEELVGIVAFAVDRPRKGASFLAGMTADYCDFVSAAHHRQEFVAAVLEKVRELQLTSLALANLPEASATSEAIRGVARDNGFHVYSRAAYSCAQVGLGRDEARQALKVSLQQKKKLRQYLRAMEREGPVVVRHLQTTAEIAEALPRFVRAHVARFAATGRNSSLETPERRQFLSELAARFGGSGAVTLTEMRIGDRPMAWNFGFQFGGSWFWYMPTFETRDEKYSPGYCLLSQIIIDACDRPDIGVVDLGLGAEGYKERFANGDRQTLYTTLTCSRVKHWRDIARYRAASAIKKAPQLEAAVRGLRDGLRRLRTGDRDDAKPLLTRPEP